MMKERILGGAPGFCLRSGGQCTRVSGYLFGLWPLPKLGDAARPAPGEARHSRAEKCFLPGACPCKKQIGMDSAGCGRRNSARPVRTLIWELSFLGFSMAGFFHRAISSKKYFHQICVSKSGLVHISQKETVPEATNPKDGASPSERFSFRGCRGEPPATLCVRAFS